MSYFLPIDVDGLQRFDQGGEAPGWYQLAVPGATLGTLPGITVPPGTTGLILQAITAVRFRYTPASVGINPTDTITLPAGGTKVIIGQGAVRDLCFLLDGTPTSLVVQYYQGAIGPIPLNR